ncbi:MAG: ribbon-helix-helix protein, CopG family, partial [Gammaproteobacteria bacterium]
MTALSIKLPDQLAELSRTVAERMGISRSEFIRQAIVHELEAVQAQLERREMALALAAMSRDVEYQKESEELDTG